MIQNKHIMVHLYESSETFWVCSSVNFKVIDEAKDSDKLYKREHTSGIVRTNNKINTDLN